MMDYVVVDNNIMLEVLSFDALSGTTYTDAFNFMNK